MKKILFAFFALCGYVASAQEGMNRQVEVTKAYTPQVDNAVKLSPTARMEDTVALRPDISYSIRPAAWQTAFGAKTIPAAMVDARIDSPQPFAYVKAGAGFPLQSVLDAYVHGTKDGKTYGAYLNHYGQYSDIENDMNMPTPATWTTNALGLYGILPTGDRTKVCVDAGLDWDHFTRYGQAVINSSITPFSGSTTTLSYTSPWGKVSFGNDFNDLSFLNFRIGAAGGYFAGSSKNSEGNFSAFADLGRMFNANRFSLSARFDGYYGEGDMKYYSNNIFNIAPRYSLETQRVKFSMGFDFAFDDNTGNTNAWFFPQIKVKWDVADGYFVPFLEVDGRLENNGYRNLARRNPYITAGAVSTQNTARYDAHAGISGSFSSAFAYKAFAGATIYRSHVGMVYIYDNDNMGSFVPGVQDITQITIGGDISGRIVSGLEALLCARLHAYPDNDQDDKAAELPSMEVSLNARYSYRNRLILNAGIDITGSRYFYAGIDPEQGYKPFVDEKCPTVADLHFSVDYKFRKLIGFFVEGRNLLDYRLYPYNHYRGLGINVLAGVKLTF